jgi:translation initiation factor 1
MLSQWHDVAAAGQGGHRTSGMKQDTKKGGLVYSTEGGRMCPLCRQPLGRCTCRQKQTVPAADGVVRVSRETKGRNGRSVTVIRGLALDADALTLLGRQLRTACGSGGTAKDGVIEVQGDHVERVMAALASQGRIVRRAGG